MSPAAATPSALTSQSAEDPSVRATLAERLQASTLAGGFVALPANFGDADGDWVTIRSSNPFEVLYLDYRLASRITPDVVVKRREHMQRFWQEKLQNRRTGATRLTIESKYGPEMGGYPELIDRAFHRLSTEQGIESNYRALVAEQQRTVLARIDEKLADYLIDSVLHPQETQALFEVADREGLSREIVAAHVYKHLRAQGLTGEQAVGRTLEQQLLGTVWGASQQESTSSAHATPQRPTLLIPLLLFSVAVVVVLLVAAALSSSRLSTSGPTPVVVTAPASAVPNTREAVSPIPSKREDLAHSGDATTQSSERAVESKQPVTQGANERDQPPVVSSSEREKVRAAMDEIRSLKDAEPTAAAERASALEAILAAHPKEYASERVDLADLRTQIQAALMQRQLEEEKTRMRQEAEERAQAERSKEWEQRILQIEALSRQGNYSGAKTLADQFLAQPDIPEAIAVRVKRLSDDAVAELQKIFGGAKIKSKTGRLRPPPGH